MRKLDCTLCSAVIPGFFTFQVPGLFTLREPWQNLSRQPDFYHAVLTGGNVDVVSRRLLASQSNYVFMELFLNVAWVLLAVPAVWIWMRAGNRRPAAFGRISCLMVLGCVLMLLFPVISASDDLHAMRPEVEESSLSKKAAQHAWAHDSHSSYSWHGFQPAAYPNYAVNPDSVIWTLVADQSPSPSHHHPGNTLGWRAPPVSLT